MSEAAADFDYLERYKSSRILHPLALNRLWLKSFLQWRKAGNQEAARVAVKKALASFEQSAAAVPMVVGDYRAMWQANMKHRIVIRLCNARLNRTARAIQGAKLP